MPTHGKKGLAPATVVEPCWSGWVQRGGKQAQLGGHLLSSSSGGLPTVVPGLFWRPVGNGSGWMEKADHFPGLRPRLKFANSVKTNKRVNVPSPGMTENNQMGCKRAMAAGWELFEGNQD